MLTNSPEQIRPNCSRVCYYGHSSILCRYHHMSNTWPPRTIPAVCSFASCLTMRRISFCRLLPALQSFLTRPDFPQKHCTRSFFEFLSFTQRANVHRHCSASAAACALRISSTSFFKRFQFGQTRPVQQQILFRGILFRIVAARCPHVGRQSRTRSLFMSQEVTLEECQHCFDLTSKVPS